MKGVNFMQIQVMIKRFAYCGSLAHCVYAH